LGWIFLQPIPETGDFWVDGVCIQSTPSSCSACAAATLLKSHGIETSEHEMSTLCLTRAWGTSMWGLYRGLKLKASGTGYRVEMRRQDIEDLGSKGDDPVLLIVGLDKGGAEDPRYEKDWGWTAGVRHAVVFLRFAEDDLVEMGDPSVGREYWTVQNIRDLWKGYAIRLIKR